MAKKRNVTTIVLLVSIIVFISLIACYFFSEKPEIKPENSVMSIVYPQSISNDCLKKGNVCIGKEIIDGIKVSILVNEKDVVDFYVISNTTEKMTLLSAENIIDDAIWYIQKNNTYGPNNLLLSLLEKTKNWSKIDYIKEYKYSDAGYDYYKDICENSYGHASDYDCAALENKAGYDELIITNGNIEVKASNDTSFVLDNRQIKARTITKEEVVNLLNYSNKEIKWLNESQKFWTLSSATERENNYTSKAYAVIPSKLENSGFQIQAYPVDKYNNIGIKAVIELEKR